MIRCLSQFGAGIMARDRNLAGSLPGVGSPVMEAEVESSWRTAIKLYQDRIVRAIPVRVLANIVVSYLA
jgi:hypothetical protein